MLYLKIVDKNKNVKFEARGAQIRETYIGEFCEGDQIYIRLDGAQTLAVKLDETLRESFVYCPNKSSRIFSKHVSFSSSDKF